MNIRPVGVLLGIALSACAAPPSLVPGPGAELVPGDPDAAVARDAGVQVTAWADRWNGDPRTLEEEVTPILVRIENGSNRQLSLRFDQFNLDDPMNGDFSPLPPYQIRETVTEVVRPNDLALSGFWVAPYLRPYYGSQRWVRSPFALDRAYYSRMGAFWERTVELPTADMVAMALPEGVLDPGGVATGFVYFERVSHDPRLVELQFEARTPDGKKFGSVRIPFSVR